VLIVPTRWLHGLEISHIESICKEHGVREAIAKPTIGANADDTFRLPIDASSSNNRVLQAIKCFYDRPVMLQPFIPDVIATGEHSLFYFGGQFSHCVLKTPTTGDFRVQEEHGGLIETAVPAKDLLAAGQRVIDAIGTSLLYARVDLVRMPDGAPALMEVELIEPSLYFNYDDLSPVKFAEALDRSAD
jgi:glutathione synthase/RimK-type ligase-like ATP-grasp enzyme